MEDQRIPTNFDALTLLISMNDEATWKQQVTAGIVHLIRRIDELQAENAELRRQLNAQLGSPKHQESNEKLVFDATHVKPRPIKGFDPFQPNRVKTLGSIVADVANGHGLNGCELTQVVQPITTGVIKKLFDVDAQKLTYTEDSVGKGRPARYAKVPTEFIRELSETICDGFNPTPAQRAQLLPQARSMAAAVARNYLFVFMETSNSNLYFSNNTRSHRKKMSTQLSPSTVPDSPADEHKVSDLSKVLNLSQECEESDGKTATSSEMDVEW